MFTSKENSFNKNGGEENSLKQQSDITFVVNLTVSVDISLTDHFIHFFISELFAQIGHDVTQLGGRNEAVAIFVKDAESLADLFLGVCVLHFSSHHVNKMQQRRIFVQLNLDFTTKKRPIAQKKNLSRNEY
ncbi:hypothetical protein BpHYR1_035773 [Brachionus plicatilis]|uniref:Uncharacterized protein n=1 Tax=Brachionus plicatilis TaxID=10195 RepID=A0A3M7S5G4_BRAPC|nr:hypothetical protein BpHYR1_035773 [Brachionus plicatilis]